MASSWRLLAFVLAWTCVHCDPTAELCFPKGFMFGVATASYQIEGAWNESGKGVSIWDQYTHEHPERVFDHTNGDVAADSYHQYRRDVDMLKQLSVGLYRFSIAWTRILPTGFSNEINPEGIKYYKNLLAELKRNGIEPLVTMYHWDLPQSLQDLGGWTNPLMAEYFLDYARVLLDNFGSSVRLWLTFNEPLTFCHDGYGGNDAPGGRSSGFEDYMCGHNVLRAHGMVYRMFQKEYKAKHKSHMGITLDFAWIEPFSDAEEDQVAAETTRQFFLGWFAHPIFSKDGDYPPAMRARVDANSRAQNYRRSRLPSFKPQEVEDLRGAFDFMGFNHYTTYLARHKPGKISQQPLFDDDMGALLSQKKEWPTSNSTWLRVVPWGFRKALNWIKDSYDNPPVLVTENGISSRAGLSDPQRIEYIDGYLRALHAAITQDRCKVVGYTYWSLLDNFEWMRGFSERFGLFEVDYSSPLRPCKPRASAAWFARVAASRCLPARPPPYYRYTMHNTPPA